MCSFQRKCSRDSRIYLRMSAVRCEQMIKCFQKSRTILLISQKPVSGEIDFFFRNRNRNHNNISLFLCRKSYFNKVTKKSQRGEYAKKNCSDFNTCKMERNNGLAVEKAPFLQKHCSGVN